MPKNALNHFLKMGEVSNRGKSHIIDLATTAAFFDRKQEIEEKYIIEAAECRLFDRNSRVSPIMTLVFLSTIVMLVINSNHG